MEFPRLVYKSASDHRLANDQAEFDALIAEGWFATVPESLGQVDPVIAAASEKQDDIKPPTRAELEQMATSLNLPFDGRTGNKKLADMIAAASEKQDA